MLKKYDEANWSLVRSVQQAWKHYGTRTNDRSITFLCLNQIAKICSDHAWDYIYELSEPKPLLDALLVCYVESQVYRGGREPLQSKRLEWLQWKPTDNASDLIDDLGACVQQGASLLLHKNFLKSFQAQQRFNRLFVLSLGGKTK